METTEKGKLLSEMFNSFEELCKFVHNGRISFKNKGGTIAFFKNDYKLKKDVEMAHTGYGHSYEDDQYYKGKKEARKTIFEKGKEVRLTYALFGYYGEFTIGSDSSGFPKYKTSSTVKLTKEEYDQEQKDVTKLFPKEHPEFNCIGIFYANIKNGKISFSN